LAKQLLLMRHAKSSHDDSSLSDFDRPLNKRGIADVPKMAGWLNEHDLVPDIIISSSAARAKATAKSLAENLGAATSEIEFHEDLYLAPPMNYREIMSRLSAQFERPIFIGHNPGMEELVQTLGGKYQVMPTSAIAVFDVDTHDWSTTASDVSAIRLTSVYRPKEIFT